MSVTTESVEVTYQLTADDYRYGLRAWQTRTPWRRWSFRLNIVVMIVLFVLGLALIVWHPTLELRYYSLFTLGIPVLWFLATWIIPRLHARRQYARMPSAQTQTTMCISDSGIRVQSKHYDSSINWSTYIGWAEGESVFVLFPQPRIYVPIPKRAFSNEQLNQFREILRRNVRSR